MSESKEKLKELFGEMSDLSDDEASPPRDRPPTPGKRIIFVPRVGTKIQRGDRETARRVAALTLPPPPPPPPPPPSTKRRAGESTRPARKRAVEVADIEGPGSPSPRRAPTESGDIPDRPAETAATVSTDVGTGVPEWRLRRIDEDEPSTGPPPVRIVLPTGRAVDVPFYAVHRSRKYKLRLAGDRWILRFNHQGQMTVCRRA